MRKIIIAVMAAGFMLAGIYSGTAQTKRHTIMFYNVENLFDTIQDPTTNDFEFLPDGVKQWNSSKYWRKMANLDKVFASIAEENKQYPTVIGVSEIENRNVLEDLVMQEKMEPLNYQIVHYDSPDARGVDVAFLYRPEFFSLEGSASYKVTLEEFPNFRTRDIVTMWGTIDGDKFLFMVAHWPSRIGGQAASEFRRMAAAQVMRDVADQALQEDPNIRVVIMGDFNDDPSDKSVSEVLGAKLKMENVNPDEFYNPFWQMHRDGYGSLAYQDGWNLFDNIVVSGNMVDGKDSGYQLWKPRKSKYYGNIFNKPWLLQSSGQYKGYPHRTYVGNNFQNGYSDHLPVFIYIAK